MDEMIHHAYVRARCNVSPPRSRAFVLCHGLVLRSPDRSQVTVKDALDIAVENPNGVFLLATFVRSGLTELHERGSKADCPGDGHTQMRCVFPGPGTYDVRLFAHRTETGLYPFAGSVQVNVRP